MERRPVLALVGTALTLPGLTGCLLAPDDSGGGDRDPAAGDGPQTTDGGRESRFAGEPCPSFVGNAARTVCYHTVAASTEPVVLSPSVETVGAPTTDGGEGDGISFQLRNDGADVVGLNPHDWRIERRTAEGWEHVAPDMYIEPWTTLERAERVTWHLGEDPTESDAVAAVRVDESLDAGVYAFGTSGVVTGGGYDDVTPQTAVDGPDGVRVEWIALFEVTG